MLMNVEISLIVARALAISTSIGSMCMTSNILSPVTWRAIRICKEGTDLMDVVVGAGG